MRTPSARLASVLVACAAVLTACGTSAPSSPSAAPTSSLVAPLGGQTETDWGVIWDTIPDDFPVYEGAIPSEEATTGPVSASLVVDGADAATVATWTDSALQEAGFTVRSALTPLEDGSIALDATGATDCRVLVTVAPLGSLTWITIHYGASCPTP